MAIMKAPAKQPGNTAPCFRMINRGKQGAEIYVYGVIGGDWFGEGCTAQKFADDLKALGDVTQIDLHIDSEGGVVSDAQAMYTLLVKHKATVTTHIDGWACSAASFLAMAGSEILIGEGGMFMIHNARTLAYGEAADLDRAAALLRTTNDTIRKKYADRTGIDDKKLRDWMDAETWFTGQEAVDAGFCDRIVENLKIAAVAQRDPVVKTMKAAAVANRDVTPFHNVPKTYRPHRDLAAAKLAAFAR